MVNIHLSLSQWYMERRPKFVEQQANSFEAFLDELEIGECYPENEGLARKIIQTLQSKYNLLDL
jgi:hypothetical protein